jgi:hypothetical protein
MDWKKLFGLALCALILVAPGGASKRAFTIEDLYRLRGIEDLELSPDGKMILFSLREDDLPRAKRMHHLWLMDFDGQNAAVGFQSSTFWSVFKLCISN